MQSGNSRNCTIIYIVPLWSVKANKEWYYVSKEIVEFLLKPKGDDSEEKIELKFRLASTLWAASGYLSQIILSKEDILTEFLEIQSNEMAVWKSRTRFWYNWAQENSVKKYLANKVVPQTIFTKFRKYFGPGVEDSVSDAELNNTIVNFISTAATGNKRIERILQKCLKKILRSLEAMTDSIT